MEDTPKASLDTREFVARWHAIVDEHFVEKVAASLTRLIPVQPGQPALEPAQLQSLARHIVEALHAAASPKGGVQAAVHHLDQVAADGEVPTK